MSDAGKIDPRLQRHFQSLKRAGIEYVAADRFNVSIDDALAPLQPANQTADDEPTNVLGEVAGRSKEEALKILAAEVAACTRCPELVESRSRTVFSDGGAHAELCFIGEAPGADEDATGVPFVGRAGQFLTTVIENGLKMKRSEVYICNVVKCRPEGNRNPEWQEMVNCQIHLERQLDIVQPKVIVALGKHAAAFIMGRPPERTPIGKLRGVWTEYRGIPVMPTWHPAYIVRQGPNSEAKRELWTDMKEVLRKLGRPVP